MRIPLTKPFIDKDDLLAIQAPLESGWLVQGPRVSCFEEMVARHCDVPYAIATSSCTSALHLSLIDAQIGPGDRVIVPAFTYVATANAVEHAGARPVFVDINPKTLNISLDAIRDCLKDCEVRGETLPKAIIPVHLFGLCAEMREISRISDAYSMTIIEDAACALGAKVDGKSPGHFGHSACFSFHPRKVITTGEGGMVVTRNEETARQLRMLRDHGADTSDHNRHIRNNGEMPDFDCLGYNYRMTDIQGALGESQMGKLDQILRERRNLAENYQTLLEKIPWLKTPVCSEGDVHTFQSYVCRIEAKNRSTEELGKSRGALMDYLDKSGISSRPGTHAVHQLGYYRKKYGLTAEQYPNSWRAHNNTITLPLYPGMTEENQKYVAETVSQFTF